MVSNKAYCSPTSLDDALRLLAGGRATILCGGTDLLPRWSKGMSGQPDALVDLKRIEELRGVEQADGEVRVGGCTVLSDVASDPVLASTAPVLAKAAGRVACPQIRNRATLGGNLCNASPAADTAIPLILLDAVLELTRAEDDRLQTRNVPMLDFFTGPGSTVLQPGEVLTRVRFKPLTPGTFADWDKFGTRPSMEIAVASVGVALRFEDGAVTHARVGYGSVSPMPLRGRGAEAELAGKELSPEVISKCEAAARAEIAPITDVRAGDAFRKEMVGVMLRRMLEDARSR